MRKSIVRLVTQAILAAAFGVLVAGAAASGEAAELAGELVSASGPVQIRPLGERVWRAAALRAVLHPGDMLRTGPGGAAEVALVQGVFRLAENTVIILPPPRAVPAAAGEPTGIRLLLYRGRALFRILKDRLEGSFDVITPSVIVGVKGTTFGVEQGARVGVVVFDGSVQVSLMGRPGAAPVIVGAGQFTVLGPDGQLTPPEPHQPGVPGAIWESGPTTTQAQPLAAPPTPAVGPAPSGPSADGGAGMAVPALAGIGGSPTVSALALGGVNPPALAAVGGPPGSSSAFTTTSGNAGATAGASGAAQRRRLGQSQRRCPPGQAQAQGKKKGGGGGPPGC